MAAGYKRIETRSWASPYRGKMAIHAAKGFPEEARLLCLREPFHATLAAIGISSWRQLPTGVVLATCTLVRCVPTDLFEPTSEQERAFGDYSPKRFAWLLTDIVALPEPILAKGALGLWHWDPPAGVTA